MKAAAAVPTESLLTERAILSGKRNSQNVRGARFSALLRMTPLLLVATSGVWGAMSAVAADKITYEEHVLPIFRNACLNCHNSDKKKAGLDLSTFQATLAGSENGKVVQSGNAATSLLFKCVKGTEEPKMPPKGDMLNDAELSIVEKWIAGQLLENAAGKAIAAASNNVAVAVVSLERPAGPPPMPGDLPLEPYVRTRSTNALTALAVSPWAPLVAVGGQKQVLLYNTETLQPLGVLPFPEGFPSILKFSRNGQILLTGGGLGGKSGKVVLWDIKTGERIATLGNEFDQVLAADLSADQQFVALGGPTKLLKIYSTKDGKLVHSIKKHTDWVTAITFSPDGRYLASADRSGGIQIWEGATGKEFNTLAGHKAMVTALAFMPGVLASSSEDGKIQLWDAKEGKEIRNWAAHAGGAAWVDFTPDGRLVSCGRDKIAKVWDQNGKALGKTEPMGDIALRTALSNDRVIVGDWTGQIRVTTLEGKPLGELTSNPPALADRISATNKLMTDAQSAISVLQQQMPVAEAKLKTERTVEDEKAKSKLAAAEGAQAAAVKLAEETKAAVQAAEKTAAGLREAPPQLEKAFYAARTVAEAAEKIVNEKRAAKAPEADLAAALSDAKAKQVARDSAQQQLEAANRDLSKAKAEVARLQGEQPVKLAAANKAMQAAEAQLAEARKPATANEVLKVAEQEIVKLKAALEQSVAQLAALKLDAERWKYAQIFQTSYNARRTLADKEAQLARLLQAAKDAPLAGQKALEDKTAAEKIVSEGPAKIQAKEAAFAQSRQAVEALKKELAIVEKVAPEKSALAKVAVEKAPTAGDVAAATKKLEEATTEGAKLREARNAQPEKSAEYLEANNKYQAFKAEIAKAQTAVAAGQKNLEPPEVKTAQAEAAQAQEALDAKKQQLKAAVQAASVAEKAVAQTKKEVATATALAAKLEKDLPQIVKDAEAQKVQAEQAALAARREVETARQEAEKRRVDWETLRNGGTKAAALSVPESKS